MNSRNRSYKNVLYVNFYIVSDILSYILVHIASLCIKYLQKNSFSHIHASLFIIFQIQWVLTKKKLSSSFLEPDWASIHLLKPNFIIKIQEKLIFKIEWPIGPTYLYIYIDYDVQYSILNSRVLYKP
jgi:hypothetical protein